MDFKETYTFTYEQMLNLTYTFLNAQELLNPKFKNETKAEMQHRMALAKKRIEAAYEKFHKLMHGENNDEQKTV